MKIRWVLWAASLLAALLAPGAAVAQALPAGVAQVTSVEGITEYRLPNGLQVLLVPDDSKPTTTVNMTYHVGSRNENYGETGMAHLLEHLLFKGTPTTRNVLGELGKRGMRANGSTSFDRTNYFASFTTSDDNLKWYLGWQADAMVNSLIARSDLDSEMTVVRNEMESGENSPGRILLQRTMAAMYTWHNYGKSTIGARADVENVDIPRLQAFYREYYQPDNATLIVAGRFDAMRTLGWITQAFAAVKKPTRVIPRTYTLDPVQDGERSVTVRRVGGAPLIDVAFHVPAGSSPDFAAAELVAAILGDAPAGRAHKRLVERQLAAQTSGDTWGLAEPGPLFVTATLAPGQDVERAKNELLATIDALASGAEPVRPDELERARTQWLNDWERTFTDPEQIGVALSDAIARGDWRLFFLERDQVQQLTLADLQRVAGERLRRDNRTVGVYLPTDQPQRAPAPAKVDVAALVKDYKGNAAAAQAEAFDASPQSLLQRTQTAQLPSGLRLQLLPKGTRGGAVQARLRLRYGDAASLQGRETVAAMAGALINKGGAGLTRQQISDRFDQLRAEVGFRASGQVLTVAMQTRRDNLPAVIELVAQLLRDPAFTPEALDEARRSWLVGIERQRKEPDALVANWLARNGNPYPRGDLRYAPTFDESEADVRAVTVEQLKAFQRRFYSAADAEFAAAGDMDPAAVRAALAAAFGDWQQPAAGALPYVRVPQPLVPTKVERYVVRTPDKQNATVRAELALPISDNDADYPALLMANYLFGSSASSRLWTRVRDREGLSYDVGSYVDWNRREPNSRLVMSAIFAPQSRDKVEQAVNDELRRALASGFTAAELDAGRVALLGSLRLQRAQDAGLAAQMVNNIDLGRTWAFQQKLDDSLAALTLDQVNAALRKYVQPGAWAIAWGGDFKDAAAAPAAGVR